MHESSRLRVEPVGADRWPEVVAAFGRRAGRPDSCWCQRFRTHQEASNRDALEQEVRTAEPPVGLLAWADGEPAGWSRVVPRATLPGVVQNRALQRILATDTDAWWVTCFAVHERHRHLGVATALLGAAVGHARTHGASVLQGHPVDVARLRAVTVGGSALFTGTLSMFLTAGFTEIGRTFVSRPVMEYRF